MDVEAVIVMLGFAAMPFFVATALGQQAKHHQRLLARLIQHLDDGKASTNLFQAELHFTHRERSGRLVFQL